APQGRAQGGVVQGDDGAQAGIGVVAENDLFVASAAQDVEDHRGNGSASVSALSQGKQKSDRIPKGPSLLAGIVGGVGPACTGVWNTLAGMLGAGLWAWRLHRRPWPGLAGGCRPRHRRGHRCTLCTVFVSLLPWCPMLWLRVVVIVSLIAFNTLLH